MPSGVLIFAVFFFYAPATTEIYTLSLHDALPICCYFKYGSRAANQMAVIFSYPAMLGWLPGMKRSRSEEHTSELQSHSDLVCRLLLEKKKTPRPRRYSYCCD